MPPRDPGIRVLHAALSSSTVQAHGTAMADSFVASTDDPKMIRRLVPFILVGLSAYCYISLALDSVKERFKDFIAHCACVRAWGRPTSC